MICVQNERVLDSSNSEADASHGGIYKGHVDQIAEELDLDDKLRGILEQLFAAREE